MFGEKDRNVKSAPASKDRDASVPGKGATLIANNTRLEGDIHFSDQLLVNGEIHGNVHAEQESDAGLTVSAKGAVVGEIRVPNVVINGEVNGDIYATKHVELAAEARVKGNVYYHLIEMVMGARVDGSLVYTPPGEAPARKGAGKAGPKEVARDAPSQTPATGVGNAQG